MSNYAPKAIETADKTSLELAHEVVVTCIGTYRLPEPTRLAHEYVNQVRRTYAEDNPQ